MSFLGGLLGPQADIQKANLQKPTTAAQSNQTFGSAQDALTQQQAFLQQLQAQNGIANQSNVFNQQQQLANQLQQQAMGQGPNPVQSQLAQNTGNNIQGQAALMAGQRGAGANAGLMARQAAMQGANVQQQANGQSATLGMQQQLAAQQALQNQQQQMANVAGQQVGNLQQGMGQQNQYAQGLYGQVSNNISNQNNAEMSNINSQNQAASAHNAAQGQMFGSLLGAGATIAAGPVASLFAKPQNKYDGGEIKGPSSYVGQHLNSFQAGGSVPGQPSVNHNSEQNDTVPAMLSPGEIVLPLSVTKHADAPKKAAEFVAALIARKQK